MKSCNMYFVAIIFSKRQCKISNRQMMLVETNTATQFSVRNFFLLNRSIRAFLFSRLFIDYPLLSGNSWCLGCAIMAIRSPGSATSAFYGNFPLQLARLTPAWLHSGRPTCIFTKEGCVASRALSEFCWAAAARSAARSLPGAFLSATGLSGAPSSASASSLSAVLRDKRALAPAALGLGASRALLLTELHLQTCLHTKISAFLAIFPNVSALLYFFPLSVKESKCFSFLYYQIQGVAYRFSFELLGVWSYCMQSYTVWFPV